jgi:Ion channel
MSPDMWGNVIVTLLGLAVGAYWLILLFGRRRHFSRSVGMTAYILLFPIKIWFWQFELIGRGLPGWYLYSALFQIIGGMIYVVWYCVPRFRPAWATVWLCLTLSLVLQLFSYVYLAHGTTKDFSVRLTHLDAFYFALGTFTTAGTGNISPISETARGLQALQMGLDFLLIAVVVVLATARYTSLLDRSKGEPNVGRPDTRSDQDVPPIRPAADWSGAT